MKNIEKHMVATFFEDFTRKVGKDSSTKAKDRSWCVMGLQVKSNLVTTSYSSSLYLAIFDPPVPG